jgi:hypothetical protein
VSKGQSELQTLKVQQKCTSVPDFRGNRWSLQLPGVKWSSPRRFTHRFDSLHLDGMPTCKKQRRYPINDKGEQLFPRNWNEEFIDAPLVKHQYRQEGYGEHPAGSRGRYRVPYALLAGCGPLRAGEALGLEIGKHICEDCRTLYIRQKAKRGDIQPFMKTQNGERDVDLCTSLAAMLKEFIGTRTAGLLFRTSSERQILQTDVLRDSLHPILKKLEHVKGGFNVFRRFRITELKKSDCPDALQHFWSGHAHTHVSERYTKLLQDRDFRLEWAEKIGMGFELPARPVAPYAPVIVFPKAG